MVGVGLGVHIEIALAARGVDPAAPGVVVKIITIAMEPSETPSQHMKPRR